MIAEDNGEIIDFLGEIMAFPVMGEIGTQAIMIAMPLFIFPSINKSQRLFHHLANMGLVIRLTQVSANSNVAYNPGKFRGIGPRIRGDWYTKPFRNHSARGKEMEQDSCLHPGGTIKTIDRTEDLLDGRMDVFPIKMPDTTLRPYKGGGLEEGYSFRRFFD